MLSISPSSGGESESPLGKRSKWPIVFVALAVLAVLVFALRASEKPAHQAAPATQSTSAPK